MDYDGKTYSTSSVTAGPNMICHACRKPIKLHGKVTNVSKDGKNIGKMCTYCYAKIKTYKRNESKLAKLYS